MLYCMSNTGENADKIPSKESDPMTQILWSATEYVGCADAMSSQSGKSCTASVCYFAKVSCFHFLPRLLDITSYLHVVIVDVQAGNCAWGKYDTWEEAVMLSDKVCSKTCPSDVTCFPN